MINKDTVYKIRLTGLNSDPDSYYSKVEWVHGYNVIPKTGGSGKTFTSKKLVNKMFNSILKNSLYGRAFVCEIVTFRLEELSASHREI
jgi:hypothetical protein